jgi:hypothetical protein
MSELSQAFGGGDDGRQLVPGSLRGYRSWRRISRRARVPSGMLPLTAVTRRSVMWAPTIHAECTEADVANQSAARSRLPDAHRSPAPSCECGIYAWYEPDDTMAVEAGLFGAFGVIEASGLVLMGDRGFRAERAQIIAVVTWNRRVAAACAEAGIAVYRRRRHLLRDYPPEYLSALLDDRSATDAAELRRGPSLTRSNHAFGLVLFSVLWARAAFVAIVAVALPVAVAVVTAVVTELTLLFVIVARLRR